MKYDKLVRDKIPQIISDQGKKAIFRVASKSETQEYLEKKLREELDEYLESRDIGELVDIYEVLIALADAQGISWFSLNERVNRKRVEAGAFDNRIILLEVLDDIP